MLRDIYKIANILVVVAGLQNNLDKEKVISLHSNTFEVPHV